MAKIALDKYYTSDNLAQHCVRQTFEILGEDWERIIEPSAGDGSFLQHLPTNTLAYDIAPEHERVIEHDYRTVSLPYIERSLVIGNPPFGRANKLSVQFVIASLKHSDYVSFIQPISQLNQNRTMKDTELVYSEDLGKIAYSGKKVHCCLNIYHKCKDGHKTNYNIPGVYSRHIFRQGKYQHSDTILNTPWDYRVAAWGRLRLLKENEFADNEIVFLVDESKHQWLKEQLEKCDYEAIAGYVTSPNLPVWRLNKWLKEQWDAQLLDKQ